VCCKFVKLKQLTDFTRTKMSVQLFTVDNGLQSLLQIWDNSYVKWNTNTSLVNLTYGWCLLHKLHSLWNQSKATFSTNTRYIKLLHNCWGSCSEARDALCDRYLLVLYRASVKSGTNSVKSKSHFLFSAHDFLLVFVYMLWHHWLFHRQHRKPIERKLLCILSFFFGNAPTTSRQGTLLFYKNKNRGNLCQN
jgi:hypothetical protein